MASSFLDPVLGWLLYIHPALAIFLISLILSIMTTLVIKYLTNQKLMKQIRDEQKDLQKEMKEHRNNPKKLTKINERFMEINMTYMSHSMKPTLYTFIPILLVFGWLNSHLGYYPLMPDTNFNLTAVFDKKADGMVAIKLPEQISLANGETLEKEVLSEVSWKLTGATEGEYIIYLDYKNREYPKEVVISKKREYAPIEKDFRKNFLFFSTSDENGLNKILISNPKVIPFEDVPVIRDIPWIGKWSWFGVYIAFSLVFSMVLRKVFDVY
jgi:uncharacterized membrane protein (DUF106 family)